MITFRDEIVAQYKWSDRYRSDVYGDILKAISMLEDKGYLYSHYIIVGMKAYRSMVVHPDIYEIVKYVSPHTMAGAIDYLFNAEIKRLVLCTAWKVEIRGDNCDNRNGDYAIGIVNITGVG